MQAFITSFSFNSSSSVRRATVSRLVRPGLSSSTYQPFSTRSNLLVPPSLLSRTPTVPEPLSTFASPSPFSSSARTFTSWTSDSLRSAKAMMAHRNHRGSLLLSSSSSSSPSSSLSPLRSVSTRFASSSAPRSSATTTATVSGHTASTSTSTSTSTVGTAKTLLSHHEEMTKVRFSHNWWKEWAVIMTVFAITGSSSVYFVKPILKNVFQLEGSMQEGPWSYRLTYVCTTMPTYSVTLLAVASVFGRRPYFQKVVLRMWSRFLPKKVLQRFQ